MIENILNIREVYWNPADDAMVDIGHIQVKGINTWERDRPEWAGSRQGLIAEGYKKPHKMLFIFIHTDKQIVIIASEALRDAERVNTTIYTPGGSPISKESGRLQEIIPTATQAYPDVVLLLQTERTPIEIYIRRNMYEFHNHKIDIKSNQLNTRFYI
ncbi:MAG: hypothetical protein K0U41_07080 [Gammaproteobacteria bacterium]|nr:hypothetical protein [Gammaproteobacteria bacterium]